VAAKRPLRTEAINKTPASKPQLQSLPDSHISTGGAFPRLAWLKLGWLGTSLPSGLTRRRRRALRMP
jgi:hypothetical protein